MHEQQSSENWTIVKFGDIAHHISKRVEPSETNLEIYVGLEHLDPESLKIKRHGVPSDVEGQKLLVKKGQIIFGKRRAYQRKVAVADWDCICSAHAMVLEANPKNVIPEFLPFFMQSDIFMNRAVSISEGSLSPTIKWSTLSRQEFKIPKPELQNSLLRIYKAIQNSLITNDEAISSLRILKQKTATSFIKADHYNHGGDWLESKVGRIPSSWSIKKLNEIFINRDNQRIPIKSSDRKKMSGEIPYYGASGIIDYVNEYIFDEPLMLLSEDGANLVERKTPIAFKVDGKSFVNNHSHVYQPKELIDIDFVVEIIENMDISGYLTGTAQPKINKAKADSILIPYPPLDERKCFVEAMLCINNNLNVLIFKRDTLLKLMKSLTVS
ncbi:restriction endonuclease subunit S [Aeromonas veronii]|uniref:restriction endonuclease subunit S n=1 Tax=Aeromonas veronii TaxID=654 RepID=UPI0021DACD18|nr:restriction endonuclease subunit S [Aeromonas veronii]UYB72243.1 restriction endonuclease subunit S [Aeromonas veronii]